jgi:hypothetical protein
VGTGDEDQRLRDLGDLEVDDLRVEEEGEKESATRKKREKEDEEETNHVDLLVVVVGDVGDAELVREEGGVDDDDVEDDGTDSEVETVGEREGEDLSEVPRVGSGRGKDTVEREGHDRSVVEEGDDEDHEGREVELESEGHDGETDDDTDGDGASVDRVVALRGKGRESASEGGRERKRRETNHALEDDTGLADGVDDGGKSGLGKNDVGGTTSGVSGTLDGDTDVGTGESGSVVGTVTSHSAEVTETLKTLDDLVLVLGEDTGETVGVEDHLVESQVLAAGREATGLENLSGVLLRRGKSVRDNEMGARAREGTNHVVTESETTSGLLGDSKLVTSNHLDANTESLSLVDGLLGVVTGRVVDGEETDELETVTLSEGVAGRNVLDSDGEGTKTTGSELLNVLLESVLDLSGLVAGAELDDDTGHTCEEERKKSVSRERKEAEGMKRTHPW